MDIPPRKGPERRKPKRSSTAWTVNDQDHNQIRGKGPKRSGKPQGFMTTDRRTTRDKERFIDNLIALAHSDPERFRQLMERAQRRAA